MFDIGVKREAGELQNKPGAAPATVIESRVITTPLHFNVGRR